MNVIFAKYNSDDELDGFYQVVGLQISSNGIFKTYDYSIHALIMDSASDSSCSWEFGKKKYPTRESAKVALDCILQKSATELVYLSEKKL